MRSPTPRRPLSARLLAALLVGGALGACGITADDAPRDIAQEQLPDTATTTLDVGEEGQTRSVELYFTRFDGSGDMLTTVDRAVPTGGESGLPTPATVLDALLGGPTEAELDSGVVSKIPPETALASQPELRNGILTVDLDDGINGVQGDGARLAFGQMVCTAGNVAGVEGVVFAIEGQPVSAFAGDGETSSAPLTCEAYDNLGGG